MSKAYKPSELRTMLNRDVIRVAGAFYARNYVMRLIDEVENGAMIAAAGIDQVPECTKFVYVLLCEAAEAQS